MNLDRKVETVTQAVVACYEGDVKPQACGLLIRVLALPANGRCNADVETAIYETYIDLRNGYNNDYAAYGKKVLAAFVKDSV